MGRGVGPVRQTSACPSGVSWRLGSTLSSLLPIHCPPHLTLSIPSTPPVGRAKVTYYARWSRTEAGLGLRLRLRLRHGAWLLGSNPDPVTHGLCVFGKLVVSPSLSFLKWKHTGTHLTGLL